MTAPWAAAVGDGPADGSAADGSAAAARRSGQRDGSTVSASTVSDGTAGDATAGTTPQAVPALQVVAGQAGPEELAAVTAVVAAVLAARQRHAEAAARQAEPPHAANRRARLARPGLAAARPADARPRGLAPRRPPALTRPRRPPALTRPRRPPALTRPRRPRPLRPQDGGRRGDSRLAHGVRFLLGHHVRFPPARPRGLGLNRGMTLDFDTCYRAVLARDPRFDGRFFTAVTSTGIYCRPVCPARTPARANMRFFPHPGAAEAAGFRACRRCRPETSPGSPEWNARADLAARAVRLISAGYVDEHGIGGLAARLAVTQRHLHRLLVAELGTGPLALARTVRLQTARRLLAETSLPVTDIAFASGFSSVRQFNATVLESSGRTPSQLRAAARQAAPRARPRTARVPG